LVEAAEFNSWDLKLTGKYIILYSLPVTSKRRACKKKYHSLLATSPAHLHLDVGDHASVTCALRNTGRSAYVH